jgi:hypothetical protein
LSPTEQAFVASAIYKRQPVQSQSELDWSFPDEHEMAFIADGVFQAFDREEEQNAKS